MLLPTGVGEAKQLTDDKGEHRAVAWTPDSQSIMFTFSEPGHAFRVYLMDIQTGNSKPITPEGIVGALITPDGKSLLAGDGKGRRWLYPIAGGESQEVDLKSSLQPNERIMGFTADGKSLRVRTTTFPHRSASSI